MRGGRHPGRAGDREPLAARGGADGDGSGRRRVREDEDHAPLPGEARLLPVPSRAGDELVAWMVVVCAVWDPLPCGLGAGARCLGRGRGAEPVCLRVWCSAFRRSLLGFKSIFNTMTRGEVRPPLSVVRPWFVHLHRSAERRAGWLGALAHFCPRGGLPASSSLATGPSRPLVRRIRAAPDGPRADKEGGARLHGAGELGRPSPPAEQPSRSAHSQHLRRDALLGLLSGRNLTAGFSSFWRRRRGPQRFTRWGRSRSAGRCSSHPASRSARSLWPPSPPLLPSPPRTPFPAVCSSTALISVFGSVIASVSAAIRRCTTG